MSSCNKKLKASSKQLGFYFHQFEYVWKIYFVIQYKFELEKLELLTQSVRIYSSVFTQFDKGYAYSIRHSYGKEGRRTDYTPYSCMKIIMSNPPSQGDYHGEFLKGKTPKHLQTAECLG